jgi:hypothetical protein
MVTRTAEKVTATFKASEAFDSGENPPECSEEYLTAGKRGLDHSKVSDASEYGISHRKTPAPLRYY